MAEEDIDSLEPKDYLETPNDRNTFTLANRTLIGLFGLMVLSWVMLIVYPEPGKLIFDVTKTTIPPFVTLILGFYFAKNK